MKNMLLRFNTAGATSGLPYTLSIAHPLIYCILTVFLLIARLFSVPDKKG